MRFTKYERELRTQLRDTDRWPGFEQQRLLERLDKFANRALANRTLEGNLAAILILHQLVEQMMRLLTRDAQFSMQVALMPSKLHFSERKKVVFGHSKPRYHLANVVCGSAFAPAENP